MNEKTLDQNTTQQDTKDTCPKTQDQELLKCQQDLADLKERNLRLSADYQNMMRRVEKERVSFKKMMLSDILRSLLDLFDNVERIKQDMQSGQATTWFQAIEFMHKDLLKLFNTYGVKEIAEYKEFNPELHEAVMHVDAPEKKSGEIVQVLQKGYTLDGDILRIARVSIAK